MKKEFKTKNSIQSFNEKRGLVEVKLKDIKNCEYLGDLGCLKDICTCYTLISEECRDAIIKEYLKDKVFVGNDLQYRFKTEDWSDCPDSCGYEYRIKPQPDYTKEIEALERKAKENGQKVIIKFE